MVPMSQGPPHIFLSYSRRDTETMHRVRASLQAEALWMDGDMFKQGKPSAWAASIQNAIFNTDSLLVLISPDLVKLRRGQEKFHHIKSYKKHTRLPPRPHPLALTQIMHPRHIP
jgi:hypothetical protein